MPESSVERMIRQAVERLEGVHKGSGSDAPGTNSRVDITTPGRRGSVPDSGVGVPDRLDLPQYGIMPRNLPPAEEIARDSRRRYPGFATHGRPSPLEPRYNEIYGMLGTDEDYDKVPTNSANNSWPVGTGLQSQALILNENVPSRLSLYPGAIQMAPVLLAFSWAQSVAATGGVYHVLFTPNGGDTGIDLGYFNATQLQGYTQHRWILNVKIADQGFGKGSVLGTFQVIELGVVGTPNFFYQLTLGWSYILPSPAFRQPRAMRLSEDE